MSLETTSESSLKSSTDEAPPSARPIQRSPEVWVLPRARILQILRGGPAASRSAKAAAHARG